MLSLGVFTILIYLTAPVTSAPAVPNPDADGSNVRWRRSDDVSLSSLSTLVEQQASVIQSMQAELAASKTRADGMENRLTSLQAKVDAVSQTVMFSARIPGDQDANGEGVSLGDHQTVVFSQAITNIGNAYNTNNGIFTAPAAGSYAFFLSQMTPNNHPSLVLAVTKNNGILDVVFSEGGSDENYDQGSSLVTTHLAVGDQVWVRQNNGNAVRAGSWTIFSGFLVQAD